MIEYVTVPVRMNESYIMAMKNPNLSREASATIALIALSPSFNKRHRGKLARLRFAAQFVKFKRGACLSYSGRREYTLMAAGR